MMIISRTFTCLYNPSTKPLGVVFVQIVKFILPHCDFFLVTFELISLFVAGSFELRCPFSLRVQIFFLLQWGFIYGVNMMGGNLENSVMRNCGYFVVGISSTQLCK